MSSSLSGELHARGVAQVIVVLRRARGAAAALGAARAPESDARALASHFVQSELSQWSALAKSPPEGGRVSLSRRGLTRPTSASVSPVRYYPQLGLLYGTVDSAGLASLRRDARVRKVSGSPALSPIRPWRVRAAASPGARTWGIEALGVPELWAQGLTGKGVVVGHLDSGVDAKHPALRPRAIAHFAEFDSLGRLVRPAPRPHDTDEHGTHTAATIAGRPVRGKHVGVAPGARLASAIVIEGGDVVARVLGGLDWAIEKGARVVSLSLGFRGWWDDFRTLTEVLRERGVLPVFAVGNEGPGTSRSPGNYAEALSVGACDARGRVPHFSSSERFRRRRDPLVPDLAAPGVAVVSARPGGGYQEMDGTSMATPHLAGLAALLLEAAPKATVADLERAIFASCRLPRTMKRERANRGVPRAARALELLLDGE